MAGWSDIVGSTVVTYGWEDTCSICDCLIDHESVT